MRSFEKAPGPKSEVGEDRKPFWKFFNGPDSCNSGLRLRSFDLSFEQEELRPFQNIQELHLNESLLRIDEVEILTVLKMALLLMEILTDSAYIIPS